VATIAAGCSPKTEARAPAEASAVAQRYFDCAGRGDAACAAALFHYPPEETPAERAGDVAAVTQSLSILEKHFGTVDSGTPINGPVMYVQVGAGSANLAYWQKHPESLQLTYRARFSRFGDGFVALDLTNLASRWEIRQVHFGLPASDPRATPRVTKAFNELR
jgi:hypothetical protein